MSREPIDAIARAVLYEGYNLYPYRASSVKSKRRFNFGVVAPMTVSLGPDGSDPWTLTTECLVEGDDDTELDVRLRFLHLVARNVRESVGVRSAGTGSASSVFRSVESLSVDGVTHWSWQEAIERSVESTIALGDVTSHSVERAFAFGETIEVEWLRDRSDTLKGAIERVQHAVEGTVEIAAERLGGGVAKVTIAARNTTAMEVDDVPSCENAREDALLRSFVSTHTALGVRGGAFVSLLDPPERHAEAARRCHNVGTWPVLVGPEGDRSAMLSSPILLYDYPAIAPESAGDLYDGTEIDEILTLRIMTLTDDEKREMRELDDRTRAILERTEAMPEDYLMKLHGTLRSLRPRSGGQS